MRPPPSRSCPLKPAFDPAVLNQHWIRCHVAAMRCDRIYDDPHLYDLLVPRGPCESFYKSVARSTGGPVLELACGTGRLTIPLARDGHRVVGLDMSECMLGRARAKAAEAGVALSLIQGDMRAFELGQRFALVIVSCNSLGHLTSNEELRSCFCAIQRHLASGGGVVRRVRSRDGNRHPGSRPGRRHCTSERGDKDA